MTDRPRIVTDEEVGKALDFLRDSAREIGEAKARSVKADKMLGHIEALLSRASDEKSAAAREAEAKASSEYLDAINEAAFSAGELAKLYALRDAAAAKIEAWRTEQSNFRAMKI
jgi:hypothetical protein